MRASRCAAPRSSSSSSSSRPSSTLSSSIRLAARIYNSSPTLPIVVAPRRICSPLALSKAPFHSATILRTAQSAPAPKAPAAKPQAASAGTGPDPVQERIQKDVKSDKVVLYMKGTPEQPMCGYSRLIVTILQHESTPIRCFVNDFLFQKCRSPPITFLRVLTCERVSRSSREFVGGADITKDMYQSGELTDMFLKAGLNPESAQ